MLNSSAFALAVKCKPQNATALRWFPSWAILAGCPGRAMALAVVCAVSCLDFNALWECPNTHSHRNIHTHSSHNLIDLHFFALQGFINCNFQYKSPSLSHSFSLPLSPSLSLSLFPLPLSVVIDMRVCSWRNLWHPSDERVLVPETPQFKRLPL